MAAVTNFEIASISFGSKDPAICSIGLYPVVGAWFVTRTFLTHNFVIEDSL